MMLLTGLIGAFGLGVRAQDSVAVVLQDTARVEPTEAPPSLDRLSNSSKSDFWMVVAAFLTVIATVAGPFLATWLALRGQERSEAMRTAARGRRVRGAIRREITSNLRTSDAMWDAVGTEAMRGRELLAASERLGARPLPVWERDAYRSLLTELPDAVGDAMAETAELYGILQRMDWSHRQLVEAWMGQGGAIGNDDRRIRAWVAYA